MGATNWKIHPVNLCFRKCANRGEACKTCVRFSNQSEKEVYDGNSKTKIRKKK